ncbi:hypothetical protein cypCar_00012675, partial [Cyprinus carpio]
LCDLLAHAVAMIWDYYGSRSGQGCVNLAKARIESSLSIEHGAPHLDGHGFQEGDPEVRARPCVMKDKRACIKESVQWNIVDGSSESRQHNKHNN